MYGRDFSIGILGMDFLGKRTKKKMNDLSANNKTFMFENSNVRILGNADEPLFCLADVCKILELSTPAKTASQIKEEFELGELNSCSFNTGFGVKGREALNKRDVR